MQKIIIILFCLFIANCSYAYKIPKGAELEELLNRSYYGIPFDEVMKRDKPFLLVMGNTDYAHMMVRFVPIGEMVDKEFGKDFNFCIINTKKEENQEFVDFFNPPSQKQPALYIVNPKTNEYLYVPKKYYNKYYIKKILKKYLEGKLN